jgi:hypothetical protein
MYALAAAGSHCAKPVAASTEIILFAIKPQIGQKTDAIAVANRTAMVPLTRGFLNLLSIR